MRKIAGFVLAAFSAASLVALACTGGSGTAIDGGAEILVEGGATCATNIVLAEDIEDAASKQDVFNDCKVDRDCVLIHEGDYCGCLWIHVPFGVTQPIADRFSAAVDAGPACGCAPAACDGSGPFPGKPLCRGGRCTSAYAPSVFAETDAGDGGLVPTDATQIVVRVNGHVISSVPAGSTCTPVDDAYTFVVATRTLSWTLCRAAGERPWNPVEGERIVDQDEAARLRTAMAQLTPAKGSDSCGAVGPVKPRESLEYIAPSGEEILEDSFYACEQVATLVYVDGLDDVVDTFATLATR